MTDAEMAAVAARTEGLVTAFLEREQVRASMETLQCRNILGNDLADAMEGTLKQLVTNAITYAYGRGLVDGIDQGGNIAVGVMKDAQGEHDNS